MVTLLLYFVFLHASLLIPGYVAVKNSRLLKGKPGLELCAAYAVSLIVAALLAVSSYALHVPQLIVQVLHWALIAVAVFFFVRQRLYKDLQQHYFPIAALVVMSLFSTLFISLSYTGPLTFVPDPEYRADRNYEAFNVKVLNVAQTNANDNSVPYRQAQFMVNRSDPGRDSFIDEWGVHFFQRTPLLGAVTAEYFILLGDKPPVDYAWSTTAADHDRTYVKFQMIAHVLNALFIIPAFLLIAHFFNRRTALVSVLFMIPSHFFLFSAFFSWPKSLVAFFMLFAWLLIFEKRFRYLLMAGVISGVAYLAHDLAVLYIGASVLLLVYFKRFRDILVYSLASAVVALPWFIVSIFMYKKPSTFIYYPFSIGGIPQVEQKDEVMRTFFATNPLKLIAIRVESLFYLLSPYQLIITEGAQDWGRRLWACSLFNVPGAIGLGLVLPAVAGFVKQIRNLPLWILILVPLILCTIIIGWKNGLGALHFAQASVVLVVGLGVWFLLERKHKVWLGLAFAANVVHLGFFTFYSYGSSLTTWLTRPRDLATLAVLVLIVAACGAAAYIVATNKQRQVRRSIERLYRRVAKAL